MIKDQIARKYLNLAMEEPSLDVAKELFAVAWRCQALSEKNGRLIKLADRAQIMADDGALEGGLAGARRPDSWDRAFQTGWASLLLRTAQAAPDFESRRQFERAAAHVLLLEARNRAIRDRLDGFIARQALDDRWRQWLDAYESEKSEQKECECCGMGCHTCALCGELYARPAPSIGQDAEVDAAAEAATV